MTINNPEKFMRGVWDWEFLNDCFDYGIKVTDVDGLIWVSESGKLNMVERNGEILFLETKSLGVVPPLAQLKAYAALVARGFTFLWIWGDTNRPQEFIVWYPWTRTHREHFLGEKKKGGKAEIKDIVKRWFHWANRMGTVH